MQDVSVSGGAEPVRPKKRIASDVVELPHRRQNGLASEIAYSHRRSESYRPVNSWSKGRESSTARCASTLQPRLCADLVAK